jgi:hypothetical protein
MSKAQVIKVLTELAERLPQAKVEALVKVVEEEVNRDGEKWEAAIQAVFKERDEVLRKLAQ